LGTLSISFFKGTLTFAIFTLSGKTLDLKDTLKLWTNGFFIYNVHYLTKYSGISSKPAKELPFKLCIMPSTAFSVTG